MPSSFEVAAAALGEPLPHRAGRHRMPPLGELPELLQHLGDVEHERRGRAPGPRERRPASSTAAPAGSRSPGRGRRRGPARHRGRGRRPAPPPAPLADQRLNLYLRRHGDQLTLSVEHRAAASISTVQLLLDTTEHAVALRTLDHGAGAAELATTAPAAPEPSLEQRLVEHLTAAPAPLTATALRKLCQVRNATLQAVLAVLVEEGRVRKDRAGYALAR